MGGEGGETYVASSDGLGEEDALLLLVLGEGTAQYLSPVLAILTYRDGEVLDVPRQAIILTRQVGDTTHRLGLEDVEVDPVGVLRNSHGPHRVPDRLRLSIEEVSSLTLILCILTTAEGDSGSRILDLGELASSYTARIASVSSTY